MKKSIYIFTTFVFICIMSSCEKIFQDFADNNPYGDGVKRLNITLVYPEGFEDEAKAGAEISILNPTNGTKYNLLSDGEGKASINLQYGFYSLSITDKGTPVSGSIPVFNKSIDQIRIADTLKGDMNINVDLVLSYAGQLIIKEIYYRGCAKPDGKPYEFYDKYIIVYNNSDELAYLDGVCFGVVEPFFAPSSPTPWSYTNNEGQRVIRDTIPIIEAVWQFPGDGTSHALHPGEEAVVAVAAAIDHTILYPNSVNLNVPGYWVCYNQIYTNANYHPSPGPNLANHWLSLLWKGSTLKAYSFSTASPAPVLFRIPEVDAQAYVNDPANRSRKPGASAATEYVMIPSSWVLDGVECLNSATLNKRLPASIDATYFLMTDTERYLSKTAHRKTDQVATEKAGGRVVYQDTNNSANDFYIRDTQSIKE
ncbi:MAG: DUF4876 domain-containing protein [Bacteroidales bacterium]|nr:DUF4876 domain-containing protein [Bacteroidales bacterium]MDD2425248.1 DUF4876 domain-containing protein [Bacteroidales bacterium]MDD3988937.1 DUF4876 domain-containing protein [Bacteroidales bacterium]MDD4638222.1 DUF4876 domain-containing protein [Bacteroidales bacterium]